MVDVTYVSTRGISLELSPVEVIFSGWASDGGLYVPRALPKVEWRQWRSLTYQQTVAQMLKHFLPGIDGIDFDDVTRCTFDSGAFPSPNPLHFHRLTDSVHVTELFHGPTWAFKDYSMAVMVELMQRMLERDQRGMPSATSGDTGAAAMEAVRDKRNIDLIVLIPYGRVSEIQAQMMLTVHEPNIHIYQVDGNSDELDEVLTPIFKEEKLVAEHNLGSANSINWIRVLVQAANWIHTYFTLTSDNDEQLTVYVPTGGCGNIAGGMYAKQLGLPIKMVACTGSNDAVYQFIRTGVLAKGVVKQTLAPAIDIQVPYNLERIFYVLSDGCQEVILDHMVEYERTGRTKIPEVWLDAIQKAISVRKSDDRMIAENMRRCVAEFSYYCCPHTATAFSHALNDTSGGKVSIVATASPEKFHDIYQKVSKFPDGGNTECIQLRHAANTSDRNGNAIGIYPATNSS